MFHDGWHSESAQGAIKAIPLIWQNKSIIFEPYISMIKGVITGDLVNSSHIATEWRQTVIDALNACVKDFSSLTTIKMEMSRGDSFQVVVGNP